MLIKQLSVFVENKPGRLSEITAILAQRGIDIRAMSISDTTDFGILRLIVNKPLAAEKALKEAGMTVSITKVTAIGFADEPGGLAGALKILAAHQIAVEYMYAFISRESGKAYVILRLSDNEAAVNVFCQNGVEVLTCEQLEQE